MKKLNIVSTLHVGKNGGESLYIQDVDGDGTEEFIFRQSPGMLDSVFYKNGWHGFIEDENADLFQLTCMKQDGSTLWQTGHPWTQEKPYNSHSGRLMTEFCDLYGDGKLKLLCIRKDILSIMDAATGEILKTAKLKTDAFNIIGLQHMQDNSYHIIVKCDGESEYGYGKPIVCYDAQLNMLWKQNDLIGGGHNIVFKDIDNDGSDEIFEGYNLIDHDGTVLWSFDFPSHSDQTTVIDINEDGIDEVIYCTDNEDFIIVNMQGKHITTISDFPHPQTVAVGHFIPDMKGLQLFMSNRATHGGSVMMDCDARTLWEFPCNGSAKVLRGAGENGLDLLLFEPGPGRMPRDLQLQYIEKAEKMGYTNLPIEGNKGFEPFLIDGSGKIIGYFPHMADSVDVTKWGLPEKQKNDFGAGFGLIMYDIDHDGTLEFVFHNRETIWVVK